MIRGAAEILCALRGPGARPRRHTYRRFYIAAAATWVGFARVSLRLGRPGEAAAALARAARLRRIAAVYPRTLAFRAA